VVFMWECMELKGWETLGTQVHAIYQLFCIFNFFAPTHRLGCTPRLSLLGGGESEMHNLRYEGSCFFSKHLRVTPWSRENVTNYKLQQGWQVTKYFALR
jgi:hypothetical protein